MTNGACSVVGLRLKQTPLLSIGTRGESRGATQVKRYLTKISLRDAHRERKPASLFQVRRISAVIPLLDNGSARIGLLAFTCSPVQLGGPFDFCAFALLSELPLGSLKIALKCTRPRQRFWFIVGWYSTINRK